MGAILVTGAGGFIGSRVASHLQGRGWEVRGMVRSSSASNQVRFPTVYGDLLDETTLEAAVRGTDTVIHCAALVHKPSATLDDHLRVNVQGTKLLIRQAIRHGAKQFIFMSTISVYGKGPAPHREEDSLLPNTPYGQAKALAEELCREEASKAGLPLVILRLSTVYGEGEPGNVSRLIRAVDRFGPIVIGDGKNQKSMTYIENIADLCSRILMHHANTTITANVADPRPYTLLEIVETIEKALGHGRSTIFANRWIALTASRLVNSIFACACKTSPITPHQVETITETSICNVNRLQTDLGFEAPILLKEGLEMTTRWLRNCKAQRDLVG